jgi:formate hydrogenlyase subunit 3/multisubunit Na+/H+ antiporter MnhD subunit
MGVLLSAMIFQTASGVLALLLSRAPRWASVVGAGGAVVGCLLGLVPTVQVLLGGQGGLGGAPVGMGLDWDATHGVFRVEMDSLSAFFLVPVLGLSALGAVYGGDYLLAYRREKSLGSPWFFYNVFVAGMVMVLVARTVFIFLVAWEVMSISAYCLVTFEHEKPESRQAGWIYLIATHLGVIFLFIAFLLLGRHASLHGAANYLEFAAFRSMPNLEAPLTGVVFVFAVIGFGAKAGFVPFHVWLPEAHPAAPSHVSGLMSGVMIKMGLYGILRMLTFLGPPEPWWGPTLAGLGLVTALVGIALALSQRDIKRVLAYSSIENMGLIALALGVGLSGLASGAAAIAVLGMTAAFLHTWNHAMMKGLMFFAAGSVLHGAGSKDMEKLGGLMKRMPWTGTAMMIGAVAMAALPPLNGFVSKWMMYLSLMQSGLQTEPIDSDSLAALLAVGLLALIGSLSALTYVRLTGIVLLGSPRSEAAGHAHESSGWLLGPMAVLLCLCLTVAIIPTAVVTLLSGPLDQVLGNRLGGPGGALHELAATPVAAIGTINAWVLGMSAVLGGVLMLLARKLGGAVSVQGPTWGCGYARPTVRIQYTGRSFAAMIAEHLLPRFLRPRSSLHAPQGLFPAAGEFSAECPDPVTEKVYEPFFVSWANRFAQLRILQQGKVNVYLAYIIVVLVLALGWVALRTSFTWSWGWT